MPLTLIGKLSQKKESNLQVLCCSVDSSVQQQQIKVKAAHFHTHCLVCISRKFWSLGKKIREFATMKNEIKQSSVGKGKLSKAKKPGTFLPVDVAVTSGAFYSLQARQNLRCNLSSRARYPEESPQGARGRGGRDAELWPGVLSGTRRVWWGIMELLAASAAHP